jgi:hypothetical protein
MIFRNITSYLSHWKVKYWSTDNTKKGIIRGNSYQEHEEISGWKAQIKTWKSTNWYVSKITYLFFNHKRINVCLHTERWRLSVCSHTFILFRLKKIVETYQLTFCVLICAFHPEITSSFLDKIQMTLLTGKKTYNFILNL